MDRSAIENVPIFAALDVDTHLQATRLAKEIRSFVGGFKIGPRLTYRYGAALTQELSEYGEVFVDNKFYDIPTTMEAAIRTTFDSGATYTTVHAAAGPEALKQLAEIESELNQKRPFTILAVTVLTSYTPKSLPPNWQDADIEEQVMMLAESVINSGLRGLVCSAKEVKALRKQFPEAFLVTPGVRFKDEAKGDQKRVMEPQQALKAGASALVVGRPICQADNPILAAEKYYQSCQ